MKMSKTIWIINQYASHIETRHWELSSCFAARGYKVVVITTSLHHGTGKYLYDDDIKYVEKTDAITYVYLHANPQYANNGGKRVFNMLDFSRKVWKNHKVIAERIGAPAFVISSSAPPFVWESGYKVAKKYSAKFIVEFRDIWPQSLVDVQGVNPKHPFVIWLAGIEKKAYRRSDAIVTTMPYGWKHVTTVTNVPKEKVHWMPNGISVAQVNKDLISDNELPKDLKEYLESHWCCVYFGSIAKCECIDVLLKAFSKVKDQDVYFAIIGDGGEKENIMKLASDLKIQNIKFFPAINRHLIPKALSQANAAVAALENHPVYKYGLSINKLNDYLVSGIPTIFACDLDNVVKEAGHFSVPVGEPEKLAQAIIQVKQLSEEEKKRLSESAKQIIADKYDYANIGKRYLDMMESL